MLLCTAGMELNLPSGWVLIEIMVVIKTSMLCACTLYVVLCEENFLGFSLVRFIPCKLPLAQLIKLQNIK